MKKLKLDGFIDVPFPVEIIWDDAYHAFTTCFTKEDLDKELSGPFLIQTYGKLLFASEEHVYISHFVSVDDNNEIKSVKYPMRIPLGNVVTILDLRENRIIYKRTKKRCTCKGAKKKKGKKSGRKKNRR